MTAFDLEQAMDEFVTLAAAAEELGVHYMTAYRYVRTGRMPAEKRGGQWWVSTGDLAAVVAEGTGARRRTTHSTAERREMLVEPFTARLIVGDTAGCWDLISAALAAGATPAEVHTKLMQTAMEAIGDGWRSGQLTVSDEHRATATAYRLLGQLGPLFRHRGRRRGSIVIGAAAGDPHAIPSAMMTDLLSDLRFDVIDLGANTPTDSFLAVASEIDDLVGLGLCVVLDEIVDSALSQLEELRTSLPDAFLVAGGPAIPDRRMPEFAALASVVTRDAQDVCTAFEHAVGEPPAVATTT